MLRQYALASMIVLCVPSLLPQAASGQTCQPQWWDGFAADELDDIVHAMVVFDADDDGPEPPALYVGGAFTRAGSVTVNHIAKWDGSTWSALDKGVGGTVFALAVFDEDGDGPYPPALYVGGNFTTVGGNTKHRIARWNGAFWNEVGGGVNNVVYALTVFDEDGDGPVAPALHAAGLFSTAGGQSVNRIAKWDGEAWSPLGDGVNNYVHALAVFDDGGPFPASLYAVGGFTTAGGGVANRIAKWNGKDWSPLNSGSTENGFDAAAYCMTVFDDDGEGPHAPALYVGGGFVRAGDTSANRIVKWDGQSWTPLGSGMDKSVWALAGFDHDVADPGGLGLYAGGYFSTAGGVASEGIARWDGGAWSPVDGGTDHGVRAMAVFDDDGNDSNPAALFVGGEFTAAGGLPSGRIAKWSCLPTPPAPPEIVTQPESQTVCDGDAATLRVIASGTPPLEYQWRKDGVDITGAVSSSYAIEPAAPPDAGLYDVIVSNDLGTVTSEPAVLTVDVPPSISAHPQSQSVCDGWAIALSVTAEGSEPLSYQWRLDDQPIDGATGPSYTVDPVGLQDAGVYAVLVFNTCGSVTSEPATLAVGVAPSIAAQPQSQSACEGETATFSVTADGTEPLSYQWRRDGDPIGGATQASYTVDPVTEGDAGAYDVRVANACGSMTSDLATLTVAVSPSITSQPQSQAVCEDDPVVFTVTAAGSEPLTYQWRQDGQPIVAATEPAYTIDAAAVEDEGVFDVVVTNPCGSVSSAPATLTVYADPTISDQPQSHSVCEGNPVTFTVTAGGAEPLSYQWRKDGQAIDGATDVAYTIDAVAMADVGDYDVVVTNPCGTAVSDLATLVADAGPRITAQPQSQSICAGDAVSFSVTVEGTEPLNCQWRRDGQVIEGATEPSYVLDPVGLDDAADYDVVVTNPCGVTTSDPATLIVDTVPTILQHPQPQSACEGDTVTFIVTADGRAPLAYQWRQDGQPIAGAAGMSYTIDTVAGSDAGEYHVVVSNACGSITSDSALLTVGLGPTITEHPQSRSICEGGAVTFSVTASGTEPLTYQWRRDGDPIGGETGSSYTIDPVAAANAGDYDVRVANVCGSVISEPATLTVYTGPTIIEQPQSQSVCDGDAVTFAVSADGMEPLAYAWRKNGVPIPDATAASYSIDPVGESDAAEYDVIVTSPCGVATSDPAELAVNVGPAIIEQPQPQSVCAGDTVTFTVVADGTQPLMYQWRHNGEPIDEATDVSYVIDPVATVDEGDYDVVVSNVCGAMTSDPASLTVNMGPTIIEQPQTQSACEGGAVTFHVTVDGTQPLEYQWRHNGAMIAGATDSSYVIDPVALDDAGDYDVLVTNPCGSITSEPAFLTVYMGPTILEQPQSQAVCESDAASFAVVVDGMPPLEYQWRRDGQVIAGAIAASFAIEFVEPGDAGSYDVIVTSPCGSVTSEPAMLTVDFGVAITLQPQSQAVCDGGAVEFSVAAGGTEPLGYQWRHDGQPIAGAVDGSYSIDPVAIDDAGDYDVVVTNLCGSVTSDPATLAVDGGPTIGEQPQSQAVCEGDAVTLAVSASGIEPLGCQWRKDGLIIAGAIEASYSIDPVTADDVGDYDVMLTNPCGVTISESATLSVGQGPTITDQPRAQAVCEWDAVTFSVTVDGVEPLDYQWRKDGQPIGGAVEASCVIDPVRPSDAGDYDVVVTSRCGSAISNTATLLVNTGASITREPRPQSVCESGVATFSVTASGTQPLTYQWRRDGQPLAGATQPSCTLDPVFPDDGGRYDVIVTSPCGSVTSAAARLTVAAGPVIVTQPQSQAVSEGERVTLAVEASGAEPLAYQWHKDGAPIIGATGTGWIINSARVNDAGEYGVEVVNPCGAAVSDVAVVTVEPCAGPPGEPTGPTPANGAAAVPIDVKLEWTAVGDADFYDVYFDMRDPPAWAGTTSATFWSVGELANETTYYWEVVAQNGAGVSASATWSFTTARADSDSEQQQPDDPPIDEIMPPGCGAGACGVGYVGTAPLTVLCLCGMKRRLRRSGRGALRRARFH